MYMFSLNRIFMYSPLPLALHVEFAHVATYMYDIHQWAQAAQRSLQQHNAAW
jgi:hypothetical protein